MSAFFTFQYVVRRQMSYPTYAEAESDDRADNLSGKQASVGIPCRAQPGQQQVAENTKQRVLHLR